CNSARAGASRPRDLQPPHLPTREIAHLAAGAVGEPDAAEQLSTTRCSLASADAVQRVVVEQVLRQRQVEIERARLEHDAEQPQRLAGALADVVAENADL